MARVFSLTMNKSKGKKERNPSKFMNKSIIYAILTGLTGVLTSVFIKIIRRNVKKSNSVSIIYFFLVYSWLNRSLMGKLSHVVCTDKVFAKGPKYIRSECNDSPIEYLFFGFNKRKFHSFKFLGLSRIFPFQQKH